MKSNPLSLFFGVVMLTGFVILSGCTTNPDVRVTQLQNQLEEKNQKLDDLRTENQKKENVILTYEKKLRQQQLATGEAEKQAQDIVEKAKQESVSLSDEAQRQRDELLKQSQQRRIEEIEDADHEYSEDGRRHQNLDQSETT